ncbi:MAG: hypothetical protein KF725_08055 [Cyclobacteriaceae bacterium]|nr:hypothetical protein [Cyclobacteriaceae bacterium]UYN87907.1 MAG: hypothetical protein KIT51_06550 [Cyclobacteriaceae bacterium]
MQKKFFWIGLAFVLASSLQVNAQYSKTDSTYKKWFIGTSLFVLLGNFDKENPPNFAQLDIGYRITGKDVIRLSPKTWKYAWPNGIHPFLNKAYKKPEEKFPGYVREIGITMSYQRFLWKGLYAQLDVMPTWQIFVNDNGNKIKDGFQIFNSYRFGYHIKLFKDKFFFQPSICVTHRAYHTELPAGFKELDDKWSKFVFPEPGFNIGFNF